LAETEPVIAGAGLQISAIEANARKKRHEVVDNALSQIRPVLTPDQQKKLDELQKARDDLHAAKDKVHALTSRQSVDDCAEDNGLYERFLSEKRKSTIPRAARTAATTNPAVEISIREWKFIFIRAAMPIRKNRSPV
jgi:hypothetical protein